MTFMLQVIYPNPPPTNLPQHMKKIDKSRPKISMYTYNQSLYMKN